MWLSLSLRRRRDPSFVIAVSLAIVSPEFNPTSIILCLSLKTVKIGVPNLHHISPCFLFCHRYSGILCQTINPDCMSLGKQGETVSLCPFNGFRGKISTIFVSGQMFQFKVLQPNCYTSSITRCLQHYVNAGDARILFSVSVFCSGQRSPQRTHL